MNKHINLLLQVQDMELVNRVNDIIHSNKITETAEQKLASDIDELKNSLPDKIRKELERIRQHYDLYVVPMVNDCCTGCFIKLPVGVANNVRNPNECIACPNCQRFLYYDDKPIERPEDNFHYKGIARFSSVNLMFPDIKAETHAGVIEEIAGLMSGTGFIEDGAEFSDALLKREALCSTAVGSGIAFPHARGIRACGLTLAVATAPAGIDFGNGEAVKLLCVSAVPTQTSIFYTELVSKIARYFSKQENIEKIVRYTTPEDMWKIIVKIGR